MRTSFAEAPVRAFADQISTVELGDHSYLVVVGDQAVVIDPQRDIERFEAAVETASARLSAVFETHVHNDYVSGGLALAQRHQVPYCVPLDAGMHAEHHGVRDGEEWPLGDWALRAMHTPGHTPHHMSYALVGPEGPVAVFTGGSMLVGAVGRTDLLGPELTEMLTRQQYRSVHDLADTLPGRTSVQPTHGAGSFCSLGGSHASAASTSTVERERAENPALTATDEETFVRDRLAALPLYPAYYPHMAPINQEGAPAVDLQPLPRLTPSQLAAVGQDGDETWLVDLRPRAAFAEGHVPGAINVPLSDDAATYIGWVLPWQAPLVLVTSDEAELDRARLQLARIGIENVHGAVTDGLEAWRAEGRPTDWYRVATFAEAEREQPRLLIDVRDPTEQPPSLPEATNVHLSQLASRVGDLPTDQPPWVHCGAGNRAAIAASLLQRFGREPVLVADDFARYAERRAPEAAAGSADEGSLTPVPGKRGLLVSVAAIVLALGGLRWGIARARRRRRLRQQARRLTARLRPQR